VLGVVESGKSGSSGDEIALVTPVAFGVSNDVEGELEAVAPSRLRKYRPTLLSHELDQNFRQGISHSLEYGPVNFGFGTRL
jgi:hypothetical protein